MQKRPPTEHGPPATPQDVASVGGGRPAGEYIVGYAVENTEAAEVKCTQIDVKTGGK